VRIESVQAIAFGPLSQESLTLAPGMQLVHGPNEAGKSSWHAALYAGLCGLPRGRGRTRREDQEFRERHRPWDGAAWQVGTIIALADGRRVELRHDLDGRVDCSAVDAHLGRDYSQEIISDGAPDGARWLGLDRRSFLAIACVRQADLLGVLERPDLLREYVQRAADSLAQDSSVAAAIDRLDQYRREYVGRDAVGAVKPLRRATEQVQWTERQLTVRQAAQSDYLSRIEAVDQLEDAAKRAATALAMIAAKRAAQVAQEAQRRLAQAQRLAAFHPGGPPPSLSGAAAQEHRVAAVLHDWSNRPPVGRLTGESAAELRAQLDALPSPPIGDLEPQAAVQTAAQAFVLSIRQSEVHEQQQPVVAPRPSTGGATPAELRQLAGVLSELRPTIDPALPERLVRTKAQASAPAAGQRAKLPLLAAGILAVLGIGAVVGALTVVGVILLIAAAALASVQLWRRAGGRAVRLHEELRDAELELRKAQLPVEEYARRQVAARQHLQAFGLAPDATALAWLASESEVAEQAQRESQRWGSVRSQLQGQQQANAARLTETLLARGVSVERGLAASYAGYLQACSRRRTVAGQAVRRLDLEQRRADRSAMEAAMAQTLAARQQAERQLRAVGRQVGIPDDDDPAALTAGLEAWQQRRTQELTANDQARESWAELQVLLAGGTLADLMQRAQQQLALPTRLAADLEPAALVAFTLESDPAMQQQRLTDAATAARTQLDVARGQLEERRRTLGSIAEAEEALAAARSELQRVLLLDETLDLTQSFLERAQQSVHQSVAPVLAAALRRRLPAITSGRYSDVRVDPENLDVQVLAPDGHWRHAALLSHGTAEQIYLLLRVALAQYLTKPGEVCPLILDDVTVHCDRERKRAVLETLHQISQERQVILFSQEEDVLAWAEVYLQGQNDRITRLA